MGNVRPASIEALQRFLKALDRKSDTGMRDYAIIVLMLDTGIRTKELLNLHIPPHCFWSKNQHRESEKFEKERRQGKISSAFCNIT